MPIDYKKTEKHLYQPKTTPSIVDVPEMTFIAVDGKGNPNTSEAYQAALEVLYGLSYSIKMSKMSGKKADEQGRRADKSAPGSSEDSSAGIAKQAFRSAPDGYFEYVVPPLEGLWWSPDGGMVGCLDKDSFCWTAMIRQPEFVTQEVFAAAKIAFSTKKPGVDCSIARLMKMKEGLCVQVMHIGSYDDEPATIAAMDKFAVDNGYATDLNDTRRHHEIYLSDPRKVATEKLKTVIRHPVVKS